MIQEEKDELAYMIRKMVEHRHLNILKKMREDTIDDLKARNKRNYIRRGNHS